MKKEWETRGATAVKTAIEVRLVEQVKKQRGEIDQSIVEEDKQSDEIK